MKPIQAVTERGWRIAFGGWILADKGWRVNGDSVDRRSRGLTQIWIGPMKDFEQEQTENAEGQGGKPVKVR
jgi:hypothetical protein